MATTLRYLVTCPNCRVAGEVDLDQFDDDPECLDCGAKLGVPVRIESFKREAKRIAE